MRRVPLLVLLVTLISLSAPATGEAAVAGCTDTANVRWEVALGQTIVDAAIVDVPGCPDGQEVALQLITDDGDVPAEPLVEAVEAERATFDLTPYDVHVRPLTGVRVFLYGQSGEETLEIIVERRFFNPAGNEQVGLRKSTLLKLQEDATYDVPGAPDRYRVASCGDLGVVMDNTVIGEGPGTHAATESGRHLVCYQQEAGGRPGPDDDTDVLGEIISRDDGAADGDRSDGSPLPLTGANALGAAGFAIVLLALGSIMLRRRES